jgi:hypothetical protein
MNEKQPRPISIKVEYMNETQTALAKVLDYLEHNEDYLGEHQSTEEVVLKEPLMEFIRKLME